MKRQYARKKAKSMIHRPTRKRMGQSGGAAMEYIIVTLFATAATMAALTFIGDILESKLTRMADEAGIEEADFDWNFGQ